MGTRHAGVRGQAVDDCDAVTAVAQGCGDLSSPSGSIQEL